MFLSGTGSCQTEGSFCHGPAQVLSLVLLFGFGSGSSSEWRVLRSAVPFNYISADTSSSFLDLVFERIMIEFYPLDTLLADLTLNTS